MDEWIFESLCHILGEELSEDLTGYITSMDNLADFDEYMKNLLDFSNKEHVELYENIKAAKFQSQSVNSSVAKSAPDSKFNSGLSAANSGKSALLDVSSSSSAGGSEKKKSKKFIKLQLSELQKGYLKEGRNPCECQATKHKLINNCLECGRIVCEQEGSGPCFYCDNMVCTKEEMEILNSDSKQADVLYRALNDRKKSETWKKAVEDRNKLLEFDRTFAQHVKIIDDEHDYFEMNNRWLTKKEREKAVKKFTKEYEQRHASRLAARKFTLDISGRRAIEDHTLDSYEDDEAIGQAVMERCTRDVCVPDIEKLLQKLKDERNKLLAKSPGVQSANESAKSSKKGPSFGAIQDKPFLEMRDLGMCLSMHQPWASLLVAGIKKHEGRSWYTPHRGILWIAAASKPLEEETLQECVQFYTNYHAGQRIRFPENYPTSCLLGCVLVQECLSQEEYQEQYPEGESSSPFVLICSDPFMLPVAFPMQGEHKIYKLKRDVHQMARDALILRRRQW